MLRDESASVSRRMFVRQSGILAGGALLAGKVASAASPLLQPQGADTGPWPQRVLGRTGVSVTTMTLGTAPCGLCPAIPPPEIADIVRVAIDLGINSIDTAPAYKQSEEGIGLALGERRKDVFLATKVMADEVAEAQESLDKSFALLKTDWIDLVYYHSAGDHDVEKAMQPGGVFDWLLKQKQAGRFRFLGVSGHHRPGKIIPLLESKEIDVLLTVVNFVDRHTYGFEDKVLPLARQHNVGIVAMKVFGGARRSAGSYENPEAPPELDAEYLERAVQYALGTPGVCTLNLGVHNVAQLRHNVEMVKRFQELSADQQRELAQVGRRLANDWGEHFGPVT